MVKRHYIKRLGKSIRKLGEVGVTSIKVIVALAGVLLLSLMGSSLAAALISGWGSTATNNRIESLIIVTATFTFLAIELIRLAKEHKEIKRYRDHYMQAASFLFASCFSFLLVMLLSMLYPALPNWGFLNSFIGLWKVLLFLLASLAFIFLIIALGYVLATFKVK